MALPGHFSSTTRPRAGSIPQIAPATALAVGLLLGALSALASLSWAPWSAALREHWPWAWLALAVAAPASLLAGRTWQRAVIALLAGLALTGARCGMQLGLQLSSDAEERVLERVTVEYVEPDDGPERRFVVRVGARRASLRWTGGPGLVAGEHWRLMLVLQAPRSRPLPGAWLKLPAVLRTGMHASGHVIASPLNVRLDGGRPGINRLRGHIARQIRAALPERDAAALAIALAVGDTSRLSPQQWRVLRVTGITHLVAISGLHVTMFCLLCAGLARSAWRHCPPLRARTRRESFAALCGVNASAAYALLSGMGIPALRTLLMLSSWYALRGWARPAAVAPAFSVALAGVLLLDPQAPVSAGFWLSFAAVAALLLAGGRGARGLLGTIVELGRAQLVVTIALLPVTLAAFGSLSLAGLAINFLAIPLFSLVLVPLVLGGAALQSLWPIAGEWLWQLYASLHALLWPGLVNLADLPGSALSLEPARWWYLLAAPAALLCLLRVAPIFRASAALALLIGTATLSDAPASGALRLWVFDAGRSSAALLLTAGHALLFDNGESWNSRGAFTRATVLPTLRRLGIARLDRVYVARTDRDRVAGVMALLAEQPVGQLQAPESAATPGYPGCESGEQWRWEGVQFTMLQGGSCLLLVTAGRQRLLLASLADRAALQDLLEARVDCCDVVLVPRGGAATGHLRSFALAARARLAIVSQSARGANARTVRQSVADWTEAGAEVWVTGRQGALVVASGPEGLQWRELGTGP